MDGQSEPVSHTSDNKNQVECLFLPPFNINGQLKSENEKNYEEFDSALPDEDPLKMETIYNPGNNSDRRLIKSEDDLINNDMNCEVEIEEVAIKSEFDIEDPLQIEDNDETFNMNNLDKSDGIIKNKIERQEEISGFGVNKMNAEQICQTSTSIEYVDCNKLKFDFQGDHMLNDHMCDTHHGVTMKERLHDSQLLEKNNSSVINKCSDNQTSQNSVIDDWESIRAKKKEFICNCCLKSFSNKSNLMKHFNIHIQEKKYICNYCQKSFIHYSSLLAHLNTHSLEKKFTCNYCQKTFNQKGSLRVHLNIHTQEKKFVCNYCQKSFYIKKSLMAHLVIHTKEKEFICDYCSKSFYEKQSLMEHLNIHTKETEFICSYCQKSFNYKRSLNKHLNIHTKEKTFICKYCQRSFNQKVHLTLHLNSHTQKEKFICNYCQKCYFHKSSLKAHLNTHVKD